ncbi:MAG: methyltransferase domain-containing protein [Candidatus Woesearchaeota archaeon]
MDYNIIANGYTNLYKEEQIRKLSIIVSALNIKNSDNVLDVGCGTAFYFNKIPGNVKGIEPSKKMIENSLYKNKIIYGHAEKLPFKDNSFNIVISLTSIHNFANYKKGILEMKRIGIKFGFSVLKRSKNFQKINSFIQKNFKIIKNINDIQDKIIICEKIINKTKQKRSMINNQN